jgi:hypothetical protein
MNVLNPSNYGSFLARRALQSAGSERFAKRDKRGTVMR